MKNEFKTTKKILEEVEQIKCSHCKKQLTKFVNINDSNEGIEEKTIFILSRSKNNYKYDLIHNEIIDNVEEKNIKMELVFCEDCFLEICKESLIGKHLYNKEQKMFLW